MRRTGYLAEMAWGRFMADESDDPVILSPIYLHEPASAAQLRTGEEETHNTARKS
jgi:hypothetical protein